MANEGTYYGIGLDVSSMKKSGQEAVDQFNRIGQSADTAGKQVGKLEEAFQRGRNWDGGGLNDLKESINLTKSALQELRIQYKDTAAAIQKAGGAGMNSALDAQLKQVKEDIDLEEAALKGLEAKLKEMSSGAGPSFRTEMMRLSNTMKQMRLDGEENTEAYRQLEQRLRELVKANKQFQQEQKTMAMGAVGMFQGMLNGVQGLMGAYSVASGVVGTFTEDQKKLQEIQTKLQSSMAILIGLQQVANTLHSTSAFRVTVLTKATQVWHAWNLNTAKGLMTLGTSAQFARTAAIGLHSALLLLGGAAVIAAIAVIGKLRDEAKKAREEQKKWGEDVGQTVGSQLAEYRRLQVEWERCNGSLDRQKQVVDKNREAWEKLGFEVNDTTTYEKVAVDNSEAVVNALVARAKAAAYASLAEAKYSEAIQLRLAAENAGTKWWQRALVSIAGAPDEYGNGGLTQEQQDEMLASYEEANKQKLLDKAAKLEQEAQDLIKNGIAQNDVASELLKGLPTTVNNTTKSTQKTYGDALAEILKQSDDFRKKLTAAEREGVREAFDQQIDIAKSTEDWETYYKARQDLAKFNYEQEKADALAAYEATEKEVAAKRSEWQKKGWDTSALDEQLSTAAALYKQTSDNIEAAYSGALRDIETDQKATNDRIAKEEQESLEKRNQNRLEYLKQFGTFEQKLAATIEDFDKRIASADDEYEKKMLSSQKAEAVYQLYRQYSDIYKLIFADAKSLTGSLLGDAINATQDEIAKAANDGDVKALADLYERLKALTMESENRTRGWGIFGAASSIAKLNAEMDKGKGADPQKVAQYQAAIQSSFKEIGSAFSELGKEMEKFDGILGDIGKTFSALGENADTFGKAFSGTMTTSEAIGTAVSGTIQLLGMVLNSIKENKKAQEEWNMTIEEADQKYRMMQLDALDYQQRNLFGVENPYKKAIDGAVQYRASMEALNEQVNKLAGGQVQTGTKKVVDWGNVGKGAAIGAAAGAAVGSIIPGIGNIIGAAIGGAIGLITGAVAGAVSTKVVPVFENLQQHYGQLFDPDTYQLNERLLADYDKLDDATKQIIDNWQEIVDKAKEAEEQMRETFSNLAGDVGKQLSDSLVAAFKNGDLYSAIDDFHDKMTDTIEDILEQLVFSSTMGAMFDQLEQRMMDSFGIGGDNDIVDDLLWMENEYQGKLEQYNEAMMQVQKSLRGLGYDVWESDQRTAQTKAALGASQDSVDESNARLTTIQGHTFEMNENVREIKNQHAQLVAGNAAILEHVQGIHSDTAEMRATMDEMKAIAVVVKSNMGTIIDRGVKAL